MRIRALVLRIIRQMRRDKRTLALIFVAPLVVMTLMYAVFGGSLPEPKVGYIAEDVIDEAMKSIQADWTRYDELSAAKLELKDGNLDAYLQMELQNMKPVVHVTLEGSDPSISRQTMETIQETMQTLIPSLSAELQEKLPASANPSGQAHLPIAIAQPELVVDTLYGHQDMSTFDRIGPMLIGVFVFLFVFMISGVSFLRERTQGTLDRLLASPLRRTEIVLGYTIGFGLFALLQTIIITAYATYVLDLQIEGSFWYVLLIALCLALTALSLSTLMSAFATNEFQMFQFIPLVIVPQVFFCGLFPLEAMPKWLQWVSVLLPLTYGSDALINVMIRGKGFEVIAPSVAVLACFATAFFVLNVWALRKYRSI
ncbi:ABC transporter permease [Paenibacillus sp. 1001270B_150601_E10]|uniref:ABC transporter permease n=1 Tax=Paenibacillus sp. 1001270B_150601_E10 TaxID=2787079 RepID=UPI00189CE3B1|nr:ABC transporter permease [Paenibacillus sp. 1001270B_150601_E10]